MNLKSILAKIRKADNHYHMIEDGDVIGVGVSGGKDSMLLLTALHWYSKFKGKSFQVIGIHIEMGFPNMNFQKVNDYCKKIGIPYYDCPNNIYKILKQYPDKQGRIQCSRCSTLKKGAVIQEAKKLGCTKVAFGHHADDAIETLFLNMIYGGKIATFEPKMYLTREKITFIRPFIYCFESEITDTVIQNKIPCIKSTCPNDGYTKRQDIKEYLNQLYQIYPISKENFLLAIHNEQQLKLWHKDISFDEAKRTFHKNIENKKKKPVS